MMRKHNVLTALAMLALGLFVSCDSSYDSTGSSSTYCSMTKVTLGSLKCVRHTTSSTGADSTYTVTITGSYYPMYIDQLGGLIYNADSLPLGTDNGHVLFNALTAEGVVAIRSLVSGQDSAIVSSTTSSTSSSSTSSTTTAITDSLDFTQPRIVTIYASDGSARKAYKMSVNVHQQNGNLFPWKQIGGTHADLAALSSQRALLKDGTMYVFGLNGTDGKLLTSADGSNWTTAELTGATAFAPRSTQLWKGKFYSLAGGRLITSADGKTWADAGSSQTFDQLFAASDSLLFATSGDKFLSSANGTTWTENTKDETGMMPSGTVAGVSTASTVYSNMSDVLVAGNYQSGTAIWRNQSDNGNKNEWIYFPQTDENKWVLPQLTSLQIVAYNNNLLAVGCDADTLTHFYTSGDNGRTWKNDTIYKVPAKAVASGSFSCLKDVDNHLWFFCGGSGTVWRGRLNRMGWKTTQTIFTRNTTTK